MNTRSIISILVMLLLSSCTHYTLLEPQRHQVSAVYSVEPQIQWSRVKTGAIEEWTVDGPILQAVRFFDGVKDGDPLVPVYGENQKRPLFRAGMNATEVQEFVVDSMSAMGFTDMRAENLRPFQFGSLPGFRFELQYLSAEGLELSGIAAGTTSGEKLYLILYTGARSHYFDKHKADVERMLQTIQISS